MYKIIYGVCGLQSWWKCFSLQEASLPTERWSVSLWQPLGVLCREYRDWLFWGHVSTESRGNSGIHQFSSMYCSRPQKPMAILTRSYLCLAEQGRPTTPTGIWDWNQFLTPSPNPLQNVPVQVSGVYWRVLQSGCQWPESLALEKFVSVCT